MSSCEKQFASKFIESIKNALIERLDNLTENEMKELDKDIIKRTIYILKSYISISDSDNANQIAEVYELKIAQKYLRCPFFEKKVRGINDLKDIFFKVKNKEKSRSQLEQMNLEATKWLTFERYAKWIVDEKIVEFIFQENPHVELIKRSLEILYILTMQEQFFSPQIIDSLWICCTQKHEDISRATFDLIQELAQYLPLERLAQLYQKISTINQNEYDDKMVIFLKNYTLSAMKNLKQNKQPVNQKGGVVQKFFQGKKDQKADDKSFYDSYKFWQIFQDSNKVSQKIKDTALSSLIDIIQEINEKEVKEQYIFLAIENMKKGDTFLSSLIFLRKLLNTYPLDS